MKTVTEFDNFRLTTYMKKADELVAGGKTPEELPQALGEEFKLEGEKLKFMLAALEVARARRAGLKRVIVMTAGEGEKLPAHVEKKEEHYYLAEFYPGAPEKKARGRDDRDRGGRDRKGKKGGKRGGRGGDRDRGERGGRGAVSATGAEGSPEGGQGGRRRRRKPASARPAGPPPNPTLQVKKSGTPAAAPEAAPAPAAESPAPENKSQ